MADIILINDQDQDQVLTGVDRCEIRKANAGVVQFIEYTGSESRREYLSVTNQTSGCEVLSLLVKIATSDYIFNYIWQLGIRPVFSGTVADGKYVVCTVFVDKSNSKIYCVGASKTDSYTMEISITGDYNGQNQVTKYVLDYLRVNGENVPLSAEYLFFSATIFVPVESIT